jgi:hypothetical protein
MSVEGLAEKREFREMCVCVSHARTLYLLSLAFLIPVLVRIRVREYGLGATQRCDCYGDMKKVMQPLADHF